MSIKNTLKKRAVSGLLVMSLAASLLTAYVIATENPVVHIDGLELRIVAEYKTNEYGQYVNAHGDPLADGESPVPIMKDGQQVQSIQALVTVSISNIGSQYCTGAYVPLVYNDSYLTPSDWVTNGAITVSVENPSASIATDDEDKLHHFFFHTDAKLYGADEDPFDWAQTSTSSFPVILGVDLSSRVAKVQVELQRGLTIKEDTLIAEKMITKYSGGTASDTYIEVAAGEKVALGTFSFRVNDTVVNSSGSIDELQASLYELAQKYNGGKNGMPKDTSDTTSGPLFQVYESSLELHALRIVPGTGINRGNIIQNVEYTVHVDSDDVIVKVQPVQTERTINSYEAYTDGQVSDLALAMQKYAESIRVTYASGDMADHAIYWGDPVNDPDNPCTNMPEDGPGMFIRKQGSDDIYRFTWDSTKDVGYRFEKWDGTAFVAADPIDSSGFAYDPKGNQTYLIYQYFTYSELDGTPPEEGETDTRTAVLKAYPTPVQVKLTVTPIKVTGVSVDHETLTYQNVVYNKDTAPDGVPEHYSALNLAADAKLALDTGLDGVVPTAPLTWDPAGLTLDSTTGIPGTGGTGNPGAAAAWPLSEDDYTNKTGVGSYTFGADVLESDVRARYPWLTTSAVTWQSKTVEGDTVSYLPVAATRRIVDTANTADADLLASRYELTVQPYEDTNGDEIGKLLVTVAKKTAAGAYDAMPEGTVFRLYLPDGTLVDSSWFGANSSSYSASRLQIAGTANGQYVYQIRVSPGSVGAGGAYQAQMETVRRYINLGGWFSLQVHESSMAADVWSDTLTDYSEPRTNIYIKSYTGAEANVATNVEKLFDYTDTRAGLMPFHTGDSLSAFVTLPADDSVAVRYDAFSGAQPGALRQFAVNGNSWTNVASATADGVTTYTYGDDLFARTYSYSDNGLVVNPNTGSYTNYQALVQDRRVTVKVEVQGEAETADKSLRLTYEQTGDSVTNTAGGEVDRVTFDTKQVGYTYQQIVTLTLTNTGKTEIRGIHIDIPTDTFTTGVPGPYFDIITAPAVNLPAGASTTFQVSYVPNLPVGTYQNITATHRIDIYDETNSKLKDFEAVIKIIEGKLHAVTLVVHPGEQEDMAREMGNASLVTGVDLGVYNGNAAPTTYAEGDAFWVLTEPVDEYKLLTTDNVQVYYEDQDGNKVYLREYTNTALTDVNDGKGFLGGDTPKEQGRGVQRLFYGQMPDYSINVHIHYYEDLYSKLRITDLHAYAWSNAVKDDATNGWTKDQVPPASAWDEAYEQELREPQSDNYAAVDGTVVTFDPEKDEYIVVLAPQGEGDDWCGVEIQLRGVTIRTNGVGDWATTGTASANGVGDWTQKGTSYYAGTNQYLPAGTENKLNVVMQVDDGDNTAVGGNPPEGYTNGGVDQDEPSVHKSISFEMPVDSNEQYMATRTVTITVWYNGSDLRPPEQGDEDDGIVRRVYKVRFVRRAAEGKAKHLANAGNSPYGMIENDKAISDKAEAKDEFDKDNHFTDGYIPAKANVADEKLTNIYWPETWGDGTNYDKDETALFVYLGKDFYEPGVKNIYNSAGDLIPDDTIVTLSLNEYYVMDTSKSSANDRFNVSGETTDKPIPLGSAKAKDGAIDGQLITFSAAEYTDGESDTVKATDIRPGVYALTYTFSDYDDQLDDDGKQIGVKQISFTRPLIVLPSVGDVDADRSLTTNDAGAIWSRFGTITKLPLELDDSVYSAQDKLLYRYRIVDTDNDRNINDVDADLVRRALKENTTLTQFYRPTDYIND